MKKMAEMQMSVVVDPRSKHAIDKQICQWDENLEKLYIEQFRLRCYTCSLQGTELPNPKVQGPPPQSHSSEGISSLVLFFR